MSVGDAVYNGFHKSRDLMKTMTCADIWHRACFRKQVITWRQQPRSRASQLAVIIRENRDCARMCVCICVSIRRLASLLLHPLSPLLDKLPCWESVYKCFLWMRLSEMRGIYVCNFLILNSGSKVCNCYFLSWIRRVILWGQQSRWHLNAQNVFSCLWWSLSWVMSGVLVDNVCVIEAQ